MSLLPHFCWRLSTSHFFHDLVTSKLLVNNFVFHKLAKVGAYGPASELEQHNEKVETHVLCASISRSGGAVEALSHRVW